MHALVTGVAGFIGSNLADRLLAAQPGDVQRTGGLVERAAELLGWSSQVSLEEGVHRQVEWHASAFPM